MSKPEDYCALFSMQAAQLRLKDAGCREKSTLVLDEILDDDETKEGQVRVLNLHLRHAVSDVEMFRPSLRFLAPVICTLEPKL